MANKNQMSNLPAPSVGGLSIYLAQIKKFPMLDAEEEYLLAKNWKDSGNLQSAHKLVTSHLRLVANIAMGYRGYGLPVNELISDVNIVLMQAVKKFDPDKQQRLIPEQPRHILKPKERKYVDLWMKLIKQNKWEEFLNWNNYQ